MHSESIAQAFAGFLERHEFDQNERVREMCEAIRTGKVELRAHHADGSCSELASTYRTRSQIVATQGRGELAAEMKRFALECEASADQTCTIWVTSGATFSYLAFEFEPSRAVAWCAKLPGPIANQPESAA